MSKKKHKSKKKLKNYAKNTTVDVKFSVSEEREGTRFEDIVKEREDLFMEIGKDFQLMEIAYPINQKTHLIEYNNKDKYSMPACTWLCMQLLDRGCRIFASKKSFFVNTSMSKDELITVINELMPNLIDDNEFWNILKCYEMYLQFPSL